MIPHRVFCNIAYKEFLNKVRLADHECFAYLMSEEYFFSGSQMCYSSAIPAPKTRAPTKPVFYYCYWQEVSNILILTVDLGTAFFLLHFLPFLEVNVDREKTLKKNKSQHYTYTQCRSGIIKMEQFSFSLNKLT